MRKLHCEKNDNLFRAVLSLNTIDECYGFFEDICTVKELEEISNRLEVARLLREGKSYGEIVRLTGASTATIGRVNKCLSYGSDGYNTVLDRMEGKVEK